MNFQDYLQITAFTAAGYTWGWFQARKPFKSANSRFLMFIGLGAGLTYAQLGSSQRLMGLEPNAREVQLYGALSAEEVERRQIRASTPNIDLIDSEDS
eukprot:CAMPEP_0170078590 /NCGR_PEP_ID=MMETSP0019_2-20121128/15143_1 /TAXON_ID=98059 /ORGANISM="Dinobryon sp., Strain UTEXLB2267" /LENGTH=97 /DNA_ID=CAMNT_0010291543 /DNA_START=95 /DNA_END=391 /DNA_ORIENTATION=-